jgi:integrase
MEIPALFKGWCYRTPLITVGAVAKADCEHSNTVRGLGDRALIPTLTYFFARIGAALKMKVEDLRPRGSAWTIRLHEKDEKEHAMPRHHSLAEALHSYIAAAGIIKERKGSPHVAPTRGKGSV